MSSANIVGAVAAPQRPQTIEELPCTIPVAMPPGGVLVDSATLEGGGQVVRVAMALACLTGRGVLLTNIRAANAAPGLRRQHITSLKLLQDMCGARMGGARVGSVSIAMQPSHCVAGQYASDTGTAGSCTLVAQMAIPLMLLASPGPTPGPGQVMLIGGTDTTRSPPIAFLQHVTLPLLPRMLGVQTSLAVVRRGFYPRGGGAALLQVASLARGRCLPPLRLETQGSVSAVRVVAYCAGKIPPHVPRRMAAAVEEELRKPQWQEIIGPAVPVQQEILELTSHDTVGDGGGVTVVVETTSGCVLGATAVNERGKAAELTGATAAREVLTTIQEGACVDQWMQDQLIVFMAMARGLSVMRCGQPTVHTRTAMKVTETMLPGVQFTVTRSMNASDRSWVVTCASPGIPAGMFCPPTVPHDSNF